MQVCICTCTSLQCRCRSSGRHSLPKGNSRRAQHSTKLKGLQRRRLSERTPSDLVLCAHGPQFQQGRRCQRQSSNQHLISTRSETSKLAYVAMPGTWSRFSGGKGSSTAETKFRNSGPQKTHFRVVVHTRKYAGVLASSVYYCGPSFVWVIYHITCQVFPCRGVIIRSRVVQKGIARFVSAIAIWLQC